MKRCARCGQRYDDEWDACPTCPRTPHLVVTGGLHYHLSTDGGFAVSGRVYEWIAREYPGDTDTLYESVRGQMRAEGKAELAPLKVVRAMLEEADHG